MSPGRISAATASPPRCTFRGEQALTISSRCGSSHGAKRRRCSFFTKYVFSLSTRPPCDTPSAFSQITKSYSLADKVSYNATGLMLIATEKQFDPLLFFPTSRYQELLENYYSVPLTVILIAINYSCTLCGTPFMRPPDHQAKP